MKPNPYQIQLDARRVELETLLSQQNAMAQILAMLPEGLPLILHTPYPRIQISNATHEQAMAVMRTIGAGRWDRSANAFVPTELDYRTIIDGIEISIYGTAASPSCRIVEETIEVPAHTVTQRKLVCA